VAAYPFHADQVVANVIPKNATMAELGYTRPDGTFQPESNYGNWVWEYGALHLPDPYTSEFAAATTAHAKRAGADALLLATANVLLPGLEHNPMKGMVAHFVALVEAYDGSSVEDAVAAEAKRLPAFMIDGLRTIALQAPFPSISARGEVTSRACELRGIDACVPNGCPSLTISRDPRLGRRTASRWAALRTSLDQKKKLKIIVTLPTVPAQKEAKNLPPKILFLLEVLLRKIAPKHDCVVVLQTAADASVMHNARRWWPRELDRTRSAFFTDVDEWRSFVAGFDLVIGARIHGTMMGVAAGVPAFLVATDLRQTELADAMAVPRISLSDLRKASGNVTLDQKPGRSPGFPTLARVLRTVAFDGRAFDATRAERVASYRHMLRGAGLELDPGLADAFPEA
jgi:hypothetical protein